MPVFRPESSHLFIPYKAMANLCMYACSPAPSVLDNVKRTKIACAGSDNISISVRSEHPSISII